IRASSRVSASLSKVRFISRWLSASFRTRRQADAPSSRHRDRQTGCEGQSPISLLQQLAPDQPLAQAFGAAILVCRVANRHTLAATETLSDSTLPTRGM